MEPCSATNAVHAFWVALCVRGAFSGEEAESEGGASVGSLLFFWIFTFLRSSGTLAVTEGAERAAMAAENVSGP